VGIAEMWRFLDILKITYCPINWTWKITISSVGWVESGPNDHPAKFCCNSLDGCRKRRFL